MMHKRTDEFLHREGVTAEQAVEECDFLARDVHRCSCFCFVKRLFWVSLGYFAHISAATAPPKPKLICWALTHKP